MNGKKVCGLLFLVCLMACQSPTVSVISSIATPTPSEAMRQDAQEYARLFGVDIDEALRRLQYQDEIGELYAALEANEAETFAGLWLEHEPVYKIVVRFTRDGQATIRPYLEGKAFAHLVEVREGQFTQAELEAILNQTLRELDKLDFDVTCLLDVQRNRVEIWVSDQAWFEGELRRADVNLLEGVVLVEKEGASTACDKDLLLTPPVPGIAFPRQKPVEGVRTSMLALNVGTLRLEDGCLKLHSFYGGVSLPIWPSDFTLRSEGDAVQVLDSEGRVVARAGQEVSMGGGSTPVTDEWVLEQIPPACRGEYFIVGTGVRPNLKFDSELFALDVISDTARTVLFLRHQPALAEWAAKGETLSGTLALWEGARCPQIQTDWGPGSLTPLWPSNWSLGLEGGQVTLQDEAGQVVARVGDAVRFVGGAIPHNWDEAIYRRLNEELPTDCSPPYWIVDHAEK
ncbi:MAG: hypothetical protein JW934_06070 [Anaerolineae bacterium]|nr:hypothetical protein [Anaerolineae bacterium]